MNSFGVICLARKIRGEIKKNGRNTKHMETVTWLIILSFIL